MIIEFRVFLMKMEKNMTQQRISQALLSYDGVRKHSISNQIYYFCIKMR